MRPAGVGRDQFEVFCKQLGLSVFRRKNPRRTTDSSGVKRFDNLLKGLQVSRINQLWQSDITYYELKGRFCYMTFIQDTYSKKIVGYSVSRSLSTQETTLPALHKALRLRRQYDLSGLILHSDGGGQYYSDEFLKLTGSKSIINSMGKTAQENGMAERLNGVIKNNYLKFKSINTFEQLVKNVDRTVYLYNQDKPHKSLGRKTPNEFENQHLETTAIKKSCKTTDP
jgi:transposase InsO family protein